MNDKSEFKDRYILGDGYPWLYGIVEYAKVGLNEHNTGVEPVLLTWPEELWSTDVPRYRLVLEKVEPEQLDTPGGGRRGE